MTKKNYTPKEIFMEEEKFWALTPEIASFHDYLSNEYVFDDSPVPDNLRAYDPETIKDFITLSPQEIIQYENTFRAKMKDLCTNDLWCVACLADKVQDKTHFEYFRAGILIYGQAYYKMALETPDALYSKITITKFAPEGVLRTTASELFAVLTGDDIELYVHKPKTDESIKLNWDIQFPSTMKAICPQTYGKFGGFKMMPKTIMEEFILQYRNSPFSDSINFDLPETKEFLNFIDSTKS